MSQPVHRDRPMVVEETVGRKAYCQCGLSEQLPYCDGAHSRENTGLKPIVVDVTEAGRKSVCQCHKSAELPWCDGAHASM